MSDKDGKKGRGGDREGEDKPPRDRRPPPERAGHIAPADPALVAWLERLWTRGTPPTRLEMWRVIGPARRGLAFHENFRPPETPAENWHIEHCARLAGELLRTAQDWADAKRQRCDFEIAIIDPYQETAPLTKPLGPFHPIQAYDGVYPDGEPRSLEDDEDGGLALKPLSHKYLAKMFRATHEAMVQTHAMMGDFMQLQQGALQARDAANERLHMINAQLHEQKQTAEDRAAERAVWVTRENAKTKVLESGVKAGTHLLYGWMGMPGETAAAAPASGGGAAPANLAGGPPDTALPPLCPPSPELHFVESFLEEARDEKVSVQLFGDWDDPDSLTLNRIFAGVGLKTPGIFTPQQFGILLAVKLRQLGPEALDGLLSDSGLPQAVTQDQTLRAEPHITQPMAIALMQIRELRLAAREKQAAPPAGAQPQGDPR